MSKCIVDGCESNRKTLLFPFPKNREVLKKWENNIYPYEKPTTRIKAGDKICSRHFEEKFININEKKLLSNAIPTLHLQKGNTLIDYEELLSEKPSTKNKRGSSGLKNLQLAREKRNIKREKMKKIAESRRFQSSSSKESTDDNLSMDYELERDYFMGNREETELEKFLISMRLANKLNDGKTSLKHPSSIRNATIFPLLNSIQHMDMLVNTNPAFWDSKRSLMFIKYCIPLKSIAIKQLQAQLIDGETICNLTSKSDLIDYLKLDENSATILSSKLEQLRKETILRYMS